MLQRVCIFNGHRIDEMSRRSQLLAYVSFSSADDISVGNPSRGGRMRSHSGRVLN